MSESFLNLYKITPQIKEKEFTRFDPAIPIEDRKTLNRVRYRLFREYNLPVIQRKGSFFVFGTVKDERVEIRLNEIEVFLLENKGTGKLEDFLNEEEVQEFIRDMAKAHEIHRKFAEDYVKNFNSKVKGRLGEIVLIPYLIERVFRKNNDFLLMLDFKFRLILQKNFQKLLEEGKVNDENFNTFKLKPRNQDFTSKVQEIKRAKDLGRAFVENMLLRSTEEITKKHWEKLLNDYEFFEKAFVVFLENGYAYPASMLHIVVDFETAENEVANEIVKRVRLTPENRLKTIREVLRKYIAVLKHWGLEISTKEEKAEGIIEFNDTLIDAQGRTTKIETNMQKFLKHLKPFVKNTNISTFVLAIDKMDDKQLNFNRKQFLEQLKEFLNSKGISLEVKGAKRIVAEKRIEALKELATLLEEVKDIELVIVFLEEYGRVDPYTEEVLLYDYIKRRLLERMIPSQIILNTTLRKEPARGWEFILLNVAEQIMAKTGNIPYKINGGIEGADYFLGIDLSRITRGKTVNVGAFTKIFAKDGTFLKYKLLSETAFGESVSKRAIQELFLTLREMKVKEGSRLVIHRDGWFQRDEVDNFIRFAKEFNYKLELVEVIKRQNPRIFPKEGKRIKGSYYKLNENTLILATYNNIYPGTHQPLRIRKVYGELPIETLASQVLSLTLMNYSSFQPIKLPATTHYADKITKLLLRDIKPAQKEGDIMYWL